MTTLYLIRHAEAEGNLYRRIHGQFDTNVTPNGRRQIAALARRFASIDIDACYSSDLTRTQTTAQAIAAPKGLPLRLEPGFREINLGIWEDRPFGWLYAFEQEEMHHFNQEPRLWHVAGAERFEEYTARFIAALTRVAQAHDGGTAAIFSHGAVMRGVMMALFPEVEIPHCDNTAVTRLFYDGGAFTLDFFNDNSHLTGNLSTLSRQKWWRNDGKRQDVNLWFRQEHGTVPGLTAPEGETYTAYCGEDPAGLLVLRDRGAAGEIVYMGLREAYRGQGLAVQLFGQAVFTLRAAGKARLILTRPADCPAFDALLRQMDLRPDSQGRCAMELKLQVFPLLEEALV